MTEFHSTDSAFIRKAMAAPYLGREEEQSLAQKWKQVKDQQALHKLTLSHMRLVIALAAKFRTFGLPMPDLIQEGHVGLLEAAARFEPERAVRFSTYATWWIRASIQDYILRNWSIVRGGTSSAQKALFFNLRRLRAKLASRDQNLQNTEIFHDIARAIGVRLQDVERMNARLSGPDVSLNAPLSEADAEGAERQDLLPDERPHQGETVLDMLDQERRKAWLNTALGVLSRRELAIVRARRLSEEGATLETLGKRLGISKERVRQIENRALEKLKSSLLSTAHASPGDVGKLI